MNVGVGKSNKAKKFWYYCLYAYGLPLVVTSIAIACDHIANIPNYYRPQIGNKTCWFGGKNSLFWYGYIY